MKFKYSKTTDLIYPEALLGRYKDLPDDLIDISDEEAKLHMGNVTLPEGKRRKKHTYPFELEDIPPPTSEQIIAQYKSDLSHKRWEVATGGVIIDGINVQSDDKSKDEMAGYVTESIVNGLVNVNWKLADGTFKVYTVQEFKKVYQFVAKYRNDCFGVEREKLDEINETGETDLETGWPANNFVIV